MMSDMAKLQRTHRKLCVRDHRGGQIRCQSLYRGSRRRVVSRFAMFLDAFHHRSIYKFLRSILEWCFVCTHKRTYRSLWYVRYISMCRDYTSVAAPGNATSARICICCTLCPLS